ncbi:hypothetical protein OSW16_06230 [Pseudomonas putida]|uniref:hypothetical protein n=1 Tax=Pseudomonas putida TaxID=303 RepID=UPI00226DAFF8|nr:hypothetical protein [Pseudomonas putida]WAB99247.1 hypothetical protein OSW16_06230 [Pseudomonas putida]
MQADTLEALAAQLDGVNAPALLETLKSYNASVREDVPFNPAIRDARSTWGLELPKSNWANPLTCPPFVAYGVT